MTVVLIHVIMAIALMKLMGSTARVIMATMEKHVITVSKTE